MINDSVEKMEAFRDVFETMNYTFNSNIGKLVGIQEKIIANTEDNIIPMASMDSFDAFESTLSRMNLSSIPVPDLLRDIYNVLDEQLFITKETTEDQKRRSELDGVRNSSEDSTSAIESRDDSGGFFANIFGGLSFARILAGFAIAPFIFQFAKGFVGSITDGLVDLTEQGLFGLAALIGSSGPIARLALQFGKMFSWVGGLSLSVVALNAALLQSRTGDVILSIVSRFASISNAVKNLFTSLAAPIARITGMLSSVGGFIGSAFNMIPGSGVIKVLLGKLAWPITLVLGFVEAWNSYQDASGDFIDRYSAAVGGFFVSVLGAPLDLLKDIVAWVLGRFGFENASAALAEFSFSDKIREIITGYFEFVGSMVDWVKELFTDPTAALSSLWQTALGGFNSLLDLIFAPIDAAIQWISGIFGWEAGENFSLSEMFDDVMEGLSQFFADLFDFLPSLDEIKNGLLALLPEWMRPDSIEEQRRNIQDQIEFQRSRLSEGDNRFGVANSLSRANAITDLENQLADLPQMSAGGIMNAPRSGGLVMLHGAEIIAPLESPQGQALTAINDLMRMPNVGTLARRDYVAANAQQGAIDQGRARTAMMNIMPQMINTTPVTSNSSSTTIINNMSPSRSLDDPSMLR